MTLRLKAPELAVDPVESDAKSPDEAVAPRKRRKGPGTRAVLIGIIAVIVAFDLAVLTFRVPLLQPELAVSARDSFDPFAADALAAEAARVGDELRIAQGSLLQNRGEFLAVMSRLETAAGEHGWIINSSIRPALPASDPAEGHQRLPVQVTLANRTGATGAGGAAARLDAWLRHLDFTQRRIDVRQLSMRGGSDGLAEIGMELHFWIVESNEETTAK